MSNYEVRLPDGRAFFESDNPLTAARQWMRAESVAKGSKILVKTSYDRNVMSDALVRNKGRMFIGLRQCGLEAKDKDEAAEIVSKAVESPD